MKAGEGLGWLGIVRLGLVQAALGSIVVLTTSTMNRVMVVELALPAMLPGALVALHYALQVLRPRLGYGSDVGCRRTPWIVGGMAVLAAGGVCAALATALMGRDTVAGIALAVAAFVAIGVGVGACGTALLVLLAKSVRAQRRAAAATTTWVMMICGFILTAGLAGHFLEPYSPARLVAVTATVAAIALAMTVFAVHGIEDRLRGACIAAPAEAAPFRQALRQVWAEPQSRRFALFIFVSMMAYSAQDLILEPFAGTVFGMSPGASTQLAGVQHAGVLLGMVSVGLLASGIGGRRFGSLPGWTAAGCIASAMALISLAAAGLAGPPLPLAPFVFALGLANGVFAVAAIGSMMQLVDSGRAAREGVRMGLWGAAQAVAFGIGGFLGTVAIDVARWLLGSAALAYSLVFTLEGLLFVAATLMALRIVGPLRPAPASGLGAPVRVGSGQAV